MEPARKITVEVPPELLEKAQRASGGGITQTVRTGLQLVAASHAYARLRRMRGKVRFSRTEVRNGYWKRAGELRARVPAKRRKARLGDALIAQSCIDGGIPLLTRDRDLRAFAEAAGLDLAIGSAAA